MEYEKTEDPKIFKQVHTFENLLYIDKIESEITKLEDSINNMPKVKTEPDQETLDHWNMLYISGTHTNVFSKMLTEKQELLATLRDLK